MHARGRCHPRRRSPRRIGSWSSRSRRGIDRRPCCGRRCAGLDCVELEGVTAVVDRGRRRPHVLLRRRSPCRRRMAQGVAARPSVCSSNSWRAKDGGKRKLSVRCCRKTTACLRSSQGCCVRTPRPVPTAWPSASTFSPFPSAGRSVSRPIQLLRPRAGNPPLRSRPWPDLPARGGVLLTVAGTLAAERIDEWRAGRTIRLPAELRRPSRYLNPGVADEERALARRGTTLVGSVKSGALVDVVVNGGRLSEAAADARAFVRRAIASAVGPWSARSAAIVTAIVIGDRAGLDDEPRAEAAGGGDLSRHRNFRGQHRHSRGAHARRVPPRGAAWPRGHADGHRGPHGLRLHHWRQRLGQPCDADGHRLLRRAGTGPARSAGQPAGARRRAARRDCSR